MAYRLPSIHTIPRGTYSMKDFINLFGSDVNYNRYFQNEETLEITFSGVIPKIMLIDSSLNYVSTNLVQTSGIQLNFMNCILISYNQISVSGTIRKTIQLGGEFYFRATRQSDNVQNNYFAKYLYTGTTPVQPYAQFWSFFL